MKIFVYGYIERIMIPTEISLRIHFYMVCLLNYISVLNIQKLNLMKRGEKIKSFN